MTGERYTIQVGEGWWGVHSDHRTTVSHYEAGMSEDEAQAQAEAWVEAHTPKSTVTVTVERGAARVPDWLTDERQKKVAEMVADLYRQWEAEGT